MNFSNLKDDNVSAVETGAKKVFLGGSRGTVTLDCGGERCEFRLEN